jgi:hypothetical protein
MIDALNEELLSLADAAKLLPRRRGGRKVHIATLYRWTTTGCKDIVLESTQVGGTRCTTKEALARFFQRLAEGSGAQRHTTAREHDQMIVEKKLDAMGL